MHIFQPDLQVNCHQVPRDMAEDDHFYISEFPVINSEDQPNDERTGDLCNGSVTEMHQPEKNAGDKNSQCRILEKNFQSRQQVTAESEFFYNTCGNGGEKYQRRALFKNGQHFFELLAFLRKSERQKN